MGKLKSANEPRQLTCGVSVEPTGTRFTLVSSQGG